MDASKLSLGPVVYNWAPKKWRDFYFQIADEAPVDTVYLGEIVCSKRQPFFEPVIADVVARLDAAGKEVIFSTLALVMTQRELDAIRDLSETPDIMVEANDISAISLLKGKPHVIGPMINVYNEGTLVFLAGLGAVRVCLPFELPSDSLAKIAAARPADTELEVQVFGKSPLAISARCYHARSRGLSKDSCQYVCAEDPTGMLVETLYGVSFLTVNGTQTLSNACELLLGELQELNDMGISRFRLSPVGLNMVPIINQYRDLLDGKLDMASAGENLRGLLPDMSLANGFFHGIEGNKFQTLSE